MGSPTGFIEYDRKYAKLEEPEKRVRHFREFKNYLPEEEQQEQGARCMDCGVPFCQSGMVLGGMVSGCPLHNLVPETNDLAYQGKWKEAYLRLAQTHCLPEFTSRVCPALCEAACTCNLHGEPVGTKDIEYAIIERAFAEGWVKPRIPAVRTGKKVAVVGSGPAGLSCALQLNRRGHLVTVFERSDRIGGLLRYGIPNMKLEKSIIDRRIRLMEEEGVIFRTGVDIGKDVMPAELKDAYDRIVLCCGASSPRDIMVPGRELKGIYFAVDFLGGVTGKLLDSDFAKVPYHMAKNRHVLVIGGGDTGNDCVGTAVRLGAKSVTQLEMMPKAPDERAEDNPWPQWPRILKTDYGQEEAKALFGRDPRVYQTTVKEFTGNKKGEVSQAVTVSLKPVTDKKTGRTVMAPVEGTEKNIAADLVLIAAGFTGSEAYVTNAFQAGVDARSNVKTEKGQYETSVPGVFTAGDMHRGQSLVVWAIREGTDAARAVDISLMGYSNL